MGNDTHKHHEDHSCGHEHHHPGGMHVHPVVNNMWLALGLNLSFTIIEFIGGMLTNSVAIISDAIHDLGDSMAIGMALVLEKESLKGRSESYTYGKRRFSTLAALITSLILIIGAVFIVYHAIPRFFHPEEVHVQGVLWLAVLGLVFNGAAVLKLKKGSKNSLNQKAVMLHLMEDALGWVAVLVGGVIMYFTQWFWIDPLLSIGIAAFILFNAIRNLRHSIRIFLQSLPASVSEKGIKEALLGISHVEDVHDMHIWTIDGEYTVLTSHLVVATETSAEIMKQVREQALGILQEFNIQHPTLQIETKGDSCFLRKC